MDEDLWQACLDLAKRRTFDVQIGGGEPTVHPRCLDWAQEAVHLISRRGGVGLITNGTCDTPTLSRLISLRIHGLSLAVSRSPWHDRSMVNQVVANYADRQGLWWPPLEEELAGIQRQGRAVATWDKLRRDLEDELGLELEEITCAAEMAVRVDPNGIVWADHPGGGKLGAFSEKTVSRGFAIARRAFQERVIA